MNARVVVVGAGYVGAEAAKLFANAGAEVWAARRSSAAPIAGVHNIQLDVGVAAKPACWPSSVSHVVYAVAPHEGNEQGYRIGYYEGSGNVASWCDDATRFVLVSSTGVYGQNAGEHVDEQSARGGTKAHIEWLQRAEDRILERQSACVLRLGGIYGPGRTRMIRLAQGDLATLATSLTGTYTNRIHQLDAAAASVHCTLNTAVPREIVGVDTECATDFEVIAYLRSRLQLAPLAPLAPAAATGKRISCARLLQTGFRHRYPGFREGYGELLDSAISR